MTPKYKFGDVLEFNNSSEKFITTSILGRVIGIKVVREACSDPIPEDLKRKTVKEFFRYQLKENGDWFCEQSLIHLKGSSNE